MIAVKANQKREPYGAKVSDGLFLCLVGLAACFIAFYPGLLSRDSCAQLEQALSNRYTDWHPPIMAALWSLFVQFGHSPAPMLLFHLLLYWSGFYFLFLTFRRTFPRYSLILPIAGHLPFLTNFIGVIWKDVGLATSWFFVFSASYYAYRAGRRLNFPMVCLVIALFVYGYLVRKNACLAAFFMMVYLLQIVLKVRGRWVVALSVVWFFAMWPIAHFVNYSLIGAEKKHQGQYIMWDDLFMIYRQTGKNYFPDYIGEQYPNFNRILAESEIWKLPVAHLAFLRKYDTEFGVQNREELRALQRAWGKAIRSEWPAYLKRRWGAFRYLLRSPRLPPEYYMHLEMEPNDYGVEFHPNALFTAYARSFTFARSVFPFFYKPYFWLIMNIGCLAYLSILSVWRRRMRENVLPLVWINLSALAYILSYFFVVTVSDFRFVYWSVLATTVSVLILPALRDKAARDSSSTNSVADPAGA